MTALLTPTYFGVFEGRITGDTIEVRGYSPLSRPGDGLEDITTDEFWSVVMERSHQPMPQAYAVQRQKNKRKFIKILDDDYLTESQYIPKRAESAILLPDLSCIRFTGNILKRKALGFENKVLIAAYGDGQSFGIWSEKNFREAGFP